MKEKVFLLFMFLIVAVSAHSQLTEREKSMVRQGMVDVCEMDTSIRVSLMYSRADNFTGKVLYKDLSHAFLHPKAAKALVKAQEYLKAQHPQLRLIIFDACRPMSIQQIMWDAVKNTSKSFYVSNPANGGGLHNYGMAVDISICDLSGDTITMGTKVDHMSSLSHIDQEASLQKRGQLSRAAVKNRQLLRDVMQKAGFHPLRTEWWHFNLIYRSEARRNYKYVK